MPTYSGSNSRRNSTRASARNAVNVEQDEIVIENDDIRINDLNAAGGPAESLNDRRDNFVPEDVVVPPVIPVSFQGVSNEFL